MKSENKQSIEVETAVDTAPTQVQIPKQTRKVFLKHIDLDSRLQPRDGVDEKVVSRLMEAIKNGAKLPPASIFMVGGKNKLAGGRHRFEAHELLGLKHLECDIYEGTFDDAWLFSRGDNNHGESLNNKEKNRVVREMLEKQISSTWSDRRIAAHVGVSNKFVGDIRREMGDSGVNGSHLRQGKDGKNYQVNTSASPSKIDQSPFLTINSTVENHAPWIAIEDERPGEDELVETARLTDGEIVQMDDGFIDAEKNEARIHKMDEFQRFGGDMTTEWEITHWRRRVEATGETPEPGIPVSETEAETLEDDFGNVDESFHGEGHQEADIIMGAVADYERINGVPPSAPPPVQQDPDTASETGYFPDVNGEQPGDAQILTGEVVAETEPADLTIEQQIEALPLAKALALYPHKGYLFQQQAKVYYEAERAIKSVRSVGRILEYTKGPVTDALQAVIDIPAPDQWEGCGGCKGALRSGERMDPCSVCGSVGFTTFPDQGVSADVVAQHAAEFID